MIAYLIEFRQRCLKVALCYAVFFVLTFYYANTLFVWITNPLAKILPLSQSFIATSITTPILTPFRLAADFALILTFPFALSQLWRYIMPALYQHERAQLRFLATLSVVLFALGFIFCFYAILPLLFQFFMAAAPQNVQVLPDMAYTLDFITRMLILFGLCFEVPLLCYALVRFSVVELGFLIRIRSYVIVGAFIMGMLLTPPDVLSQVVLAVPLCLLYELGIVLCRFNLFAAKRLKMQQKQSG